MLTAPGKYASHFTGQAGIRCLTCLPFQRDRWVRRQVRKRTARRRDCGKIAILGQPHGLSVDPPVDLQKVGDPYEVDAGMLSKALKALLIVPASVIL